MVFRARTHTECSPIFSTTFHYLSLPFITSIPFFAKLFNVEMFRITMVTALVLTHVLSSNVHNSWELSRRGLMLCCEAKYRRVLVLEWFVLRLQVLCLYVRNSWELSRQYPVLLLVVMVIKNA